MATSYTSLLGLALPVTGELAGTWGDTVNNSITSLLDTAVAGTTTLSTDADVTLTTTTGASNQARQAILLCSGARTALRTITAPAQSKIYVVINNTTGGYGVKLVGAGPTTGVTVANGKTAVLVWNGSDFVEVAPATATTATNLAGGAAGSVPYQTGAGATTFLSLGTAGQVLQVNAGATAPEWVNSTGTGSVVRATSPTIATPTITTSATVPLLIGGTGTTSTLTLRSTSGVGTTGADIIFQTGNNGATEAMRVLNSGRIGVATTSPLAQLDVSASGGSAANNFLTATFGADDTGGTSRTDATAKAARLGFAHYTNAQSAAAFAVLSSTSTDNQVSIGGGTGSMNAATIVRFMTAANNTTLNGTERMRITSAGDVGIGVTNPSSRIHVESSSALVGQITTGSASGGETLRLRNTATKGPVLSFYQDGIGVPTIGMPDGVDALIFSVSNTERMRIKADGNVGINLTPGNWGSSWKALQITGGALSSFSTTELWLQKNAVTTGTGPVYVVTDFASSYTQVSGQHRWYTAPSGTAGNAITYSQNMTLDANGVLMVNATTPLANTRVHIAQNSDSNFSSAYSPGVNKQQLVLRDLSDTGTYTNPYTQVTFLAGATGAGVSYIAGAREGAGTSFMAFGTGTSSGATERMRIDSSGRVLIGQTASRGTVAAKLQVDDSRISITSAANGIIGGLAPDSSVSNSLNIEADPDNVAASSRIVMSVDGGEKMRLDASGNLLVGTTSVSERLTVNGNIALPAATTEQRYIKVGNGRTGNGFSYIDLIGDATYTTFGLRIIRNDSGANSISDISHRGTGDFYINTVDAAPILLRTSGTTRLRIDANGNVLNISAGGLGYGTGSGGAVTQATSRTTGVTLDKTNGAITLVSAAGTATWQSFTVTNNTVAATDTVIVSQKSGADLYQIFVTAVANGSFRISFATTGGTTTEQPVFNFAVIKAVTA